MTWLFAATAAPALTAAFAVWTRRFRRADTVFRARPATA